MRVYMLFRFVPEMQDFMPCGIYSKATAAKLAGESGSGERSWVAVEMGAIEAGRKLVRATWTALRVGLRG